MAEFGSHCRIADFVRYTKQGSRQPHLQCRLTLNVTLCDPSLNIADSPSKIKMQRRCKNCQSFSVCDIDDEGLLLFEDAQDLKLAAGGGQNHPSCDLCAIIWWSFRKDWRRRPLNRGHGEFVAGEFNVRAYRNPPRGAGAIQRLDILVMPPGGSHGFSWMPGENGSWRIGPSDERPSVVRSHLMVYSDASWSDIYP